jgi:hypothetical protein
MRNLPSLVLGEALRPRPRKRAARSTRLSRSRHRTKGDHQSLRSNRKVAREPWSTGVLRFVRIAPCCRGVGFAFVLLLLFLAGSASATSPTPSPTSDDIDDLLGFLTGSYRLVGKELDSNKPFVGQVIINLKGKQLQVLRTVNGVTMEGVGRIEVASPESSRVLRIRFTNGNNKFEGTYLYHSDLDNYARITGYPYKIDPKTGVPIDTKNPGLEALFPEAPLKPWE